MTRFKIMIEGSALYADMKQVFEKVEELGFELTMVDNGNIVCELGDGEDSQQDETARTLTGDMASNEVSLDALKSTSNKRDGSPVDTSRNAENTTEVDNE